MAERDRGGWGIGMREKEKGDGGKGEKGGRGMGRRDKGGAGSCLWGGGGRMGMSL